MIQKIFQKNSLSLAVIIFGFSALVAQILLMRELIVIFYGNELSLGTILGVWLLWTAAGSGWLSKLFRSPIQYRFQFALIQILFAIQFPLSLFLIRWSKSLLGISLGEMIGYTPMLLVSLLTLAPVCLLSGCLYTLACQCHYQSEKNAKSRTIGRIYFLEAIGSGLGGLLTSFIFIRWFKPAELFWILASLNLISAFIVGKLIPFKLKILRTAWIVLLSGILILSGIKYSGAFQNHIDRLLWKGFDLVTTKNTIYGNLTFTKMGNQYSIFENGLLFATIPDPLTAEESVHFTLLEHPEPRQILIIGGGVGGGLREILRHPTVANVDYVELDPEVIHLSKQILPSEAIASLSDPRIHIHHIDGRRFIQNTRTKYDAILLILPTPYTIQLNRFYTLEFFQAVRRILCANGLFSLQLNASENAIGPELAQFLSAVYTTLDQIFQEIVMIPGETVRFISTNKADLLTADPQILIKRLQERQLQTLYVREYYLPYHMSNERQHYLQSKINVVPKVQFNRDFKPIGYFFDTVLWATHFSPVFKKIFIGFSKLKLYHFAIFLSILTLVLILISFKRNHSYHIVKTGIVFSLFNVGFTEIALEIILILSFQIVHGYVYYQLALLIACYMIGLTVGSRMTIRGKMSMNKLYDRFILYQAMMTVYPILLSILFKGIEINNLSSLNILKSQWAFSCYIFLAGLIGGYQFPVANQLYLGIGTPVTKTAGFLYSMDLTGSSLGVLITSAFLIPIFGIHTTLLILVWLNFCSLFLLFLSHRYQKKCVQQIK